jgi:hypothetical protein
MSGRLKISFAADMPPASVEVVAPDYTTVGRLYLAPGENKSVDVPSEGSFLRVHLQSGQTVTLKDPGNLDRTISALDIVSKRRRDAGYSPVLKWAVTREIQGGPAELVPPSAVANEGRAVLGGGLSVSLRIDRAPWIATKFIEPSAVICEVSQPFLAPGPIGRSQLLLSAEGIGVNVNLPGSVAQVEVRSTELADRGRMATVRIKTFNAHADTIATYLYRGDLYSAQSGIDWAEKAEQLLMDKITDPFAATVGAYLLLRLRRVDLLHDWTRNLMDMFPNLSDAVIIRAWHLIYSRGNESEIRSLFEKALDSALPIFTEGLRLLSDGARLIDKDSDNAVQKLNRLARRGLNRSPFTATIDASEIAAGRWEFDIDYASSL